VAWNAVAFGWLHWIGLWAGRLPTPLERIDRVFGYLGLACAPRYGTVKNVEVFSDRFLDYVAGEPSRWWICLVPRATLPGLFRELHAIARRWRDERRVFSTIALYTKGLRSAWLGGGEARDFCELTLYVTIADRGMDAAARDACTAEIDQACLTQGAFRYLHTRTSSDPARRAALDPSTRWAPADATHS
jgi:hypothetical protein